MIAYLVSWTGMAEKSDFQVETFSHPNAASTALTSLEKTNLDRSGKVLNSQEDLVGVGGAFLVRLFNTITGKDQKGFHDLATGRKLVWEALAEKYPDPEPTQQEQGPEEGQTQEEPSTEAVETTAESEGETDMATKKVTKSKAKSKKTTNGGDRKPGVIDAIVSLLQAGGGTIEQMAGKLSKKFPDRDAEGLKATLKIQVNRLPKSKEDGGRKLKVKKEKIEGTNEVHYSA